jgi:hypothetical protein
MDASLSSLIIELFATLQMMTGMPAPTSLPYVHRVPQDEIRQQFCKSPCAIRAVYEPSVGVFIDETLDVQNNLFDRSILLHELVHHLQAVQGRFEPGDTCVRRNTAEKEAYALQNRYLMEMNDGHRVSMTGWAARCEDAEVPTPRKGDK